MTGVCVGCGGPKLLSSPMKYCYACKYPKATKNFLQCIDCGLVRGKGCSRCKTCDIVHRREQLDLRRGPPRICSRCQGPMKRNRYIKYCNKCSEFVRNEERRAKTSVRRHERNRYKVIPSESCKRCGGPRDVGRLNCDVCHNSMLRAIRLWLECHEEEDSSMTHFCDEMGYCYKTIMQYVKEMKHDL